MSAINQKIKKFIENMESLTQSDVFQEFHSKDPGSQPMKKIYFKRHLEMLIMAKIPLNHFPSFFSW